MSDTETDTAPAPTANRSRLLSILSLIAGILGVVISWLGFGLLLPIAAIVLGAMGRKREKRAKRFWLAGILLGVAGLIISVVSLFYQFLALVALTSLSNF